MQSQIIKQKIERFIVPYYNELTFYLMSVTLLLLIFTNIHFEIPHFNARPTISRTRYQLFNFVVIFIIGLLLPIFHVFVKRKKSELTIFLIQTFSVIINTIVCLYSFGHVYNTTKDWFYIFPMWNFIYACVLPIMIHYDLINVDQAFVKEASLKEVFVSSLVLVIVFYLCQYVYDIYWGLTFSICIICSTNLSILIGHDKFELDNA
jgi:hypothetical protein